MGRRGAASRSSGTSPRTTQIDVLDETRPSARSYYLFLTVHGLDHWGRYLDEFAPRRRAVADHAPPRDHRRRVRRAAGAPSAPAAETRRAPHPTAVVRAAVASDHGRDRRPVDSSRRRTLLDAPLAELMARAAALPRRRARHPHDLLAEGVHPTDDAVPRRCGYCTFAKPPAHLVAPYLELDEVLAIARRGVDVRLSRSAVHARRGPRGRAIPTRPRGSPRAATPRPSTTSRAAAARARRDRPAPPRQRRRARRRPSSSSSGRWRPSQGMMIETLAGAPRRARVVRTPAPPTRPPARRLGHARSRGSGAGAVHHRHPRRDRRDPSGAARRAASRSGAAHARHGHVQEVIVQNFLPKTGTSMWRAPACPPDEFLWTIAAARIVLDPADAPAGAAQPVRPDDLAALVAAGIDDWGGVSPVTPDHVNPERPWPALDRLREPPKRPARTLAPRLTVYPEFVRDGERVVARRRALRGAVRIRQRRSRGATTAWSRR